MTRPYDADGYRETATGWERLMPDGRTVQAHGDPDEARRVLEEMGDDPA